MPTVQRYWRANEANHQLHEGRVCMDSHMARSSRSQLLSNIHGHAQGKKWQWARSFRFLSAPPAGPPTSVSQHSDKKRSSQMAIAGYLTGRGRPNQTLGRLSLHPSRTTASACLARAPDCPVRPRWRPRRRATAPLGHTGTRESGTHTRGTARGKGGATRRHRGAQGGYKSVRAPRRSVASGLIVSPTP